MSRAEYDINKRLERTGGHNVLNRVINAERSYDSISRRIKKASGRKITSIHEERCPSLGIVTQVPIKLEEIVVVVDMEVIDAAGYALILETDWLRKARAIIQWLTKIKHINNKTTKRTQITNNFTSDTQHRALVNKKLSKKQQNLNKNGYILLRLKEDLYDTQQIPFPSSSQIHIKPTKEPRGFWKRVWRYSKSYDISRINLSRRHKESNKGGYGPTKGTSSLHNETLLEPSSNENNEIKNEPRYPLLTVIYLPNKRRKQTTISRD
ncbi:hypothetical protein Glove_117g293 [Diversispora epigaea]|uniref:Uncharacterized protein n=1 Tax=Diversispora epigaea TaxID=1348612 RepID=A0A397J086_9GLOM|nr:hypothetical protein Glove_117g293 [Diversispora epigaea]